MTPEQAKKLLADGVIQAFAEGRKVEWRVKGEGEWLEAASSMNFDCTLACEYRVKPEPRRVWVSFEGPDESSLGWSVWRTRQQAGRDGRVAVEFVEVMKS